MVEEQCAHSLAHMILRGSRMTGDGLKISYHIIYPWLVFPSNTTMLREEVGAMSEMPQFQCSTANGKTKSFIDPGVYNSNRQFRLLLCNKLSDQSRTPLHIFSPPTIDMFARSCITHIESKAGWIPQEAIQATPARKSSVKARRVVGRSGMQAGSSAPEIPTPLIRALSDFLHQLLRKQGQPNGTLTMANQTESELRFRWQVASGLLRPCMTAQIWRPSQAGHMSNGSWISVDRLGGVYLICLHPQCLQRGYCNRRLLGQVPLSLLSLSSGGGGGATLAAEGGRDDCGADWNNLNVDGFVAGEGSDGEGGNEQLSDGRRDCNGGVDGGAGLNLGMEVSRRAAAPARQMMKRRSRGGNTGTLPVPDSEQPEGGAPPGLAPDSEQEGAPPVPAYSHAPPSQSRADTLTARQCPSPSVDLRDQHHMKLSREQSLARVADENQQENLIPLLAWNEDTAHWGGRVPDAPAVQPEARIVTVNLDAARRPGQTEHTLQAWMDISAASPFSAHPPESVLQSVLASLEQDNACLAQEHAREYLTAHSETPHHPTPPSAKTADVLAERSWSIGPSHEWRQAPIISRPSVGKDLVNRASESMSIEGGADEGLTSQFRMDTWSSPFTVGYLNVGRCHLVGSLQEVVEVVLRHRPDILFLGDLVTSRTNIGRLKKRLESALHDEWFVTTNISELQGRPVGIGAIVHCSLANRMTDCVMQYPGTDVSEPNKQAWSAAVEGRVQCIKVTSVDSPVTWQFVGVYQHVAASANRTARAVVLATLSNLVTEAGAKGHRVAILGDFNAAPPGGRWGYSKWSAAVKEDQAMTDWINKTTLTEVFEKGRPTCTWRPSEGPQRAALDRVLISQEEASQLELSVEWHCPLTVFDHALLVLRIKDTLIGTGFAGACKPSREMIPVSRCRVNLRKLREHIDEWQQGVREGLRVMQREWQDNPPDPFEALKRGELLADSLAQAVAPKHNWRPGETRRAFGFAGNRLLFRELNLLVKARSLVHKVLSSDPAILQCPHRLSRWSLVMSNLHSRVRRSGHPAPVPLPQEANYYFSPAARGGLQDWLKSAGLAIASRRAAVRESYEKARYSNLQNLRKKRKDATGALDKRTIQAALGKCQPRQRMWGVSGKVVLGVRITKATDQLQTAMLKLLQDLEVAEDIVHLAGDEQGLTAWFSGPRQAGDFIAYWSSVVYPATGNSISPLCPPGKYIATRPDDMLSVQEWHMASEGMDTYSNCPKCQAKGLHVLSTSANQQRFGNLSRAVRFFCEECQSTHDAARNQAWNLCPPAQFQSRY